MLDVFLRAGVLTTGALLSLPGLTDEFAPGGQTSVHQSGPHAFSLPSANMAVSRRLDFSVGNSFFRNPWVSSPSSTTARDGLGPLFNTNACQNCHVRDGRGHAPAGPDDDFVTALIRLSIPEQNDADDQQALTAGRLLEPHYGGQLQDFSIQGVAAEARIRVRWKTVPVALSPTNQTLLRQPVIQVDQLQYGPLHPQTQLSMRVAPPMIGLGLLEAIDAQAILAHVDEQDEDGDGISGRANWVWSREHQQAMLGRFGWKAGQPTLNQQNAAAFQGDLGLTSRLFPESNCTAAQTACLDAPNGGSPEVSDEILSFILHYTRNLAVPFRDQAMTETKSDAGMERLRLGKTTFHAIGCAACHTPSFITGKHVDRPEQSQQEIWPYSDLLLHDMGAALADDQREFLASGSEWRTPPLWGIGHTLNVSGEVSLLHDGRARNVEEAILWHDGEAARARQRYLELSTQAREALVYFVNSL
ncbi:MAG: thiol oxidoreductase [Hahellaceae bacterium]|nr:thiol oxidoreductase [Hahellaceae bacterium]